jgi:hypothetical protein
MSLPLVDALQTLLIAPARGREVPARVHVPRILHRALREPILHFLVLGGLLYWASTLPGRAPTVVRNSRIEVPAAEVSRMRKVWALQWRRPPRPEELRSLIDDCVREEVLFREAIAMGLDRNDDIVRRRLVQKMEFLTPGATAGEEKGEEGVD